MSKPFLGLGVAFIGLLLVSSLAFSQQVIQVPPVTGGQAKPAMIILKPDVRGAVTEQASVVEELYKLLEFDLMFSDAFEVSVETAQAASIKQADAERGSMDFKEWARIGVNGQPLDYLVKTVVVSRGAGLYELDLLVFDIKQGVRLIGTAYGADPHPAFNRKLFRVAGHQATGDIISTLTNGEVKPITKSRIAFINQNVSKRVKELFLIDYDGWKDSLTQVTHFNSVTLFPDWSPDGTQLAYVSYKDSNAADAFIQHLASGKVSVLARFKNTNTTPRWCPNGKELLISLSAEGNFEIYRLTPGSKNPKRLTFNKAIDEAPDMSPSGNQIAYISDRIGSPQVYLMDVDGTNNRRISFIERKCDTPMWSPEPVPYASDGVSDYRIAFTGFYSSLQSDIYTVLPDGKSARMLTDGRGDNQNASWSPNARYIAFSSNRSGKHEIYIMSSDPDRLLPNGERFFRLTYQPGENLSPAWSPN